MTRTILLSASGSCDGRPFGGSTEPDDDTEQQFTQARGTSVTLTGCVKPMGPR